MPEKSLPTKPDENAAVVPPKGKGPSKGARPQPRRAIKGKMVLKPATTAAVKTSLARKATTRQQSQTRPDQEPARRRSRSHEQYVRLRLRVEDGEMSIVDSHLVDGPLIQSSTLHGAYAYEIKHESRLLHAGSIPDLGVVRSFAHPDGTPEQRGHHSYELSSYEFDARVPAEQLTRQTLANIAVVLYRVKDRAPIHPMSTAPLGVQFERELREVARVVGIPSSVLPTALKAIRRTTRKKR
jgi:hypothetical protein